MSKHTDTLLDAVQEIAAIIYYQSSLKDQDRWLNDIMDKGIWLPEEDENTTYDMSVEETLKNMESKE